MDSDQYTLSGGSPCTYVSYAGCAKIVRIKKTPTSVAQSEVIGGPGYKGYEVWFRFIPELDMRNRKIKPPTNREHLFTLYNGWYVGYRYLEKYGIKMGKTFPCVLKVIETGTCSPVLFEFKTIDPKDYFEAHP